MTAAIESSRSLNARSRRAAEHLARELKEPLLALAAETRALAEKHDCSNAEEIRGILAQVARLQSVINAYIRPEARAPQLKAVDLGAIVNECMLLLAAASVEGTRIDLTQAPALLPVFADEAQLSQALYRLALYAIESAKTPGRVAIATGREDRRIPRQIFFEIATEDSTAESGFVPLNDEESPLLAVKRIIDLHGGDFTAEPRKDADRGARYRITLPELVEYHI